MVWCPDVVAAQFDAKKLKKQRASASVLGFQPALRSYFPGLQWPRQQVADLESV